MPKTNSTHRRLFDVLHRLFDVVPTESELEEIETVMHRSLAVFAAEKDAPDRNNVRIESARVTLPARRFRIDKES